MNNYLKSEDGTNKPLPSEVLKTMRTGMKSPEGTFCTWFTSSNFYNIKKTLQIIPPIVAGGHIFALEKDHELNICFYHSSPGTGTRKASISLKSLIPPVERMFFCFTWSPEKISLFVGSDIKGSIPAIAEGMPLQKKFVVGNNGNTFQVGDEGIHVMEARVYRGGESVLEPTAIDAWNAILSAVKILLEGQVSVGENFLFEVVLNNQCISMLVTGYESYCKKRFLELESEGISMDLSGLIKIAFNGLSDDARDQEAENNPDIFLKEIMKNRRINFQNYEECKKVYNKVYKIKFGEIGVPSGDLELIQKLIKHRHTIVHVSPMCTFLNPAKICDDDIVTPKISGYF